MTKQISFVMIVLFAMIANLFFISPNPEGNDETTGLLISLALMPAITYFFYSLAIDFICDEPIWGSITMVLISILFIIGSAGVFDTVLMKHHMASKLLEFSVVIPLHGIAIYCGLKEARKREKENNNHPVLSD